MIHFQSDDRSFQVILEARELRELMKYCANAQRNETGGILVGKYINDRSCLKITRVGGPTDDSTAGRSWFVRGIRGLQEWIDDLWRNGKGYYVGEWHFHPGAAPEPSGQDIDQICEISRSKEYNCPEPVLLIFGGDPRSSWIMSATIATRSGKIVRLNELSKQKGSWN